MKKTGDRQTMDHMLKKMIKIMWMFFFVLMFGLVVTFFIFPKVKDINKSKHFTDATVKRYSQQVLTAIEESDYDALCAASTEDLITELTGETLQAAKFEICEEYGSKLQISDWYISEVKQNKQYYAVAHLVVAYEHVTVDYTFSFDEDMKLAGFYMDKQ